jgi:3'-phosphoadenosine 5'-phosphosulfate sulfotransferase (PAPS reductase)/FAD synthetase
MNARPDEQHNIVSLSGGKDSTATLLVARAWEVSNLSAVFADTGHEHPATFLGRLQPTASGENRPEADLHRHSVNDRFTADWSRPSKADVLMSECSSGHPIPALNPLSRW